MKFLAFFIIVFLVIFYGNFMGFADFIRHKKTNFTYERNDAELLKRLRLQKPADWQEENGCIAEILKHREQIENDALLFVGGFCDGFHAYLYRVIPEFKKRLTENNFALDVFYREHDDLYAMEELLTAYHKQGKKIFIVGHSWGACSVFKTFWQYAALPVDLVISLDPVGLVRPHGQAEHIKKWVNVYLDYSVAPFTLGNCVARIGQPFGKRENASENILTTYDHQQAQKMFFDYAYEMIIAYL